MENSNTKTILEQLQEYRCKQWWDNSGIEESIIKYIFDENKDE
jgi:hypothetical protein